MERVWTPAQRAAMDTEGRTLLVSAAAGSGKTATLTERIIKRLTDPEHPAELSRLLIVTFTRAAASELREKIAAALTRAIARDPGNRHLQKQLIGIGNAHISTIDAFVREPIKVHFAELGLPAATRIADEAELAPLRERVMGEIIDEYYIRYATVEDTQRFSLLQGNPFAALCDSLTSSKNDATLIPTLLELYEKLLAFPEELGRLASESDALTTAAERDFFASDHGRILQTWIGEFCASAAQTLEEALELIRSDEAASRAYFAAFDADLSFCRRLGAATTYEETHLLLDLYRNERLGALRGAGEEFKAIKDARGAIVDEIKHMRDTYCLYEPEHVREQMQATALMCRVLYDLLTEYDHRILSEKQARGICDFTDNRRYLLRLLRTPDGTPTVLAGELSAQFDEVYIDEYQDVDELQDEIFRLIGGDHRFMVGDIKQSIYGFRGADPSVFARYRRTLPSLADAPDGAGGNSIFMSENFRCDEGVIRVTNAVCGHAFRACPDSVAYADEDDLRAAKPHEDPHYRSSPVEITVLVKPNKEQREMLGIPNDAEDARTVTETEAVYVANRIAELLRSGATLENGAPIRPENIAILMRSRTAMQTYLAALSAMGVPTGSEEMDALQAGRDILHGDDMMYLVNLLRVMDNPDADIPLSEVLRAPFPGLSLEDVIAVRRAGERGASSRSLYAGVETYAEVEGADPLLVDKLASFTAWIERYRTLCATQSAAGLLRLLRQDERCACRHTDAYLYLYESARNCRVSTFVSLYTFLKYFEKKLLTTKNADTGKEALGGQVTLMTIHKSKGLEFPVCFVVRCGEGFNTRSQANDLIFEKTAGMAMKLYRRGDIVEAVGDDPANAIVRDSGKSDTALRTAAALAVMLTEREEEMRVLYVAMTRARERLFLVGVGSDKPVHIRAGDRYATLSASDYLDWILAGLAAHPEVREHYDLRYVFTTDVAPGERLPAAHLLTGADDNDVAAAYRAMRDRHTEPTAMETLLRRVPTKVSASGMRPYMLDTCVFYDIELPDDDGKLPVSVEASSGFCDARTAAAIRESLRLMTTGGTDEFELLLGDKRRPTASEMGTAAHLFLQYCDYGRVSDGITPLSDALDAEIARLSEKGFLNARTVEILDRPSLLAFFASDFFAHMKDCVRLEREMKFSRFVPLSTLTENATLSEALGDRTLYVQGSIDLLGEFADGHIELCDYKTDRITPAERQDPALLSEHLAERHGHQLAQYAAAVEEMYGRRPSRVYIYSLPLGEAVEIAI